MSSIKSIYRLLVLAVAAISSMIAAAQDMAPVSIKAKADSTTLVMGDRTNVNIEVLKNSHEGALIGLPEKGVDYNGVELCDLVADSVELGNGRVQLNYRLTIQAFTPSELLVMPPFGYVVDGDTVLSDIVSLKVLPVELSPELGDINDIENLKIHPDELTQSIKAHFFDFVPDWFVPVLIVIAVVLVIVALVIYLLRQKKKGTGIFQKKRQLPPYELAIDRLHKLKGKRLIENGLAKQFYTEATDIWRTYLAGRFGIPAMEMTSRQIMSELRKNKDTRLSAQEMDDMLQISDFVKFAAMSPSRDEMTHAYDTILSFVEATRPQPDPENDSAESSETSEK